MVEIPDQLACLFTGSVIETDDSYTIEVPADELDTGAITPGETYRVVILENAMPAETDDQRNLSENLTTKSPEPPVSRGEMREVTIKALGDQGDGIAKIERGYVLIVPGARPDDQVTVEIIEVRQNVAFAEVRHQPGISESQ